MNSTVFDAVIKWFSKEEGGRTLEIPFKKTKYSLQIAINGEKVIQGSSWSVLCYSYEFLEPLKTKSYIRLLNVEYSPNILHIGMNFELFEGNRKVATGEIVNDSDFVFIL